MAAAEVGARVVIAADIRETPREGGPGVEELVEARGATCWFVVSDVSQQADAGRIVATAYFTIGMWVLSEIVSILVGKSEFPGRQNGLTLTTLRDMDPAWIAPAGFWWASFAALGGLVLMVTLLRSRLGLALMAARDNGVAASSLGIDVWSSRFLAFVVSGAGTGLCGAIYFLSPAACAAR